jgi:hypothetical protein
MALKDTDQDRFKSLRQKAKALNFGVPGGMQGDGLIDYARNTYGVEFTRDEADAFHTKLTTEVYPELTDYLANQSMGLLASRIGCTEAALWTALDPEGNCRSWLPIVIPRVLAGKTMKARGGEYSENTLDRIWGALCRCCRDQHLLALIRARQGCPELAALCHESAVTLTGRIRAGCIYTEAHNTPFQGLASDGAKLALFELIRAQYRVVAFVHDEFGIELPAGADHATEAKRIEEIVCNAMSVVINHTVPVRAEYTLSTCWSKKAKAKLVDGKLVPVKPVVVGKDDEGKDIIEWQPDTGDAPNHGDAIA